MAEATVPLVMYHEGQRIVIGEAVVDTETLAANGRVSVEGSHVLNEVIATGFVHADSLSVDIVSE